MILPCLGWHKHNFNFIKGTILQIYIADAPTTNKTDFHTHHSDPEKTEEVTSSVYKFF